MMGCLFVCLRKYTDERLIKSVSSFFFGFFFLVSFSAAVEPIRCNCFHTSEGAIRACVCVLWEVEFSYSMIGIVHCTVSFSGGAILSGDPL